MAANRTMFGEQLKVLDEKVFLLAKKTMQQIATVAEALEKYDREIALRVIENDTELDELELEINDGAIILIAKQQPVATDLRHLVTAMKIATDLERIADYAGNIAKAILRVETYPYVVDITLLKETVETLLDMTETALVAYRDVNVEKAKELQELDNRVDEMTYKALRQYMRHMSLQPVVVDEVMQFTNICRYLERMGDHLTNVGEHLIYMEKGKHYDLN
ncbi:phosphate signaling complex protein PhoU [Exiguobacterium flavidum]|uniref:phosphate signaling complex protein PhoU n=1 Tax=Exiguobacterium flavidum TaxID=2184695 RepID=UPI000DF82D62|nr:phosphate signaling complex protein PhoU [Exiguobacterium flavidum]